MWAGCWNCLRDIDSSVDFFLLIYTYLIYIYLLGFHQTCLLVLGLYRPSDIYPVLRNIFSA